MSKLKGRAKKRAGQYRDYAAEWANTPVTTDRAPVWLAIGVALGMLAIALDAHRDGLGRPAAVGGVLLVACVAGLWRRWHR